MGSGLTIASESWHGQVEGDLTDKHSDYFFLFLYFTEGIQLPLRRGGLGSIPVLLWETRVLVIFHVGFGNTNPLSGSLHGQVW